MDVEDDSARVSEERHFFKNPGSSERLTRSGTAYNERMALEKFIGIEIGLSLII